MRNKFTGFVDIFKFAFVQTVKSKAFVVSQIIICAIALLIFPLITIFSGDGDDSEENEIASSEYIGTVFIQDEFKDGALAEAIAAELGSSEVYGDKKTVVVEKNDYDDVFTQVEKSEQGDVLIRIQFIEDVNDVDYGFMYSVYYGEAIDKLSEAASELSVYIDDIHEKVLASLLVEDETMASYISKEFSYEVNLVGADSQIVEDEGFLGQSEYWVTYAFLMVAILTISIGGSKVAEQLVTEKTTKVIEYIMTSVKPMALITGKVLAAAASVLFVIGSAVVCLLLSAVLNGVIFPNADGSIAIPEVVVSFFNSDIMAGANPLSIVVAVLLLIGGVIFYGFIGGIAGATVSKVEEMAEGMKLYTFTMLIGAYLPMFMMIMSQASAGDWGIVTNIIYLLPLTSVFIVPAYILIGKVTLITGLISLVIMVLAVLLMLVIVSRIFEHLIYYNGSPLKFKDLIKIYKDKRRAK